jgi:hypothetical protein
VHLSRQLRPSGNYGQPYDSGFVVSEKNGVWGRAIEVPGLAALEGRLGGDVFSLSCASADNCAADGGYSDGTGTSQGFAAAEKNGVWGRAIEMPRPGWTEQGRRQGQRGVMRHGRPLRRRRILHRPPPSLPGLRREPDRIRRAPGRQSIAG